MDIFEYVAVLTSIIIGLGITHLLRGVAGLIQHPDQHRIYWVHLVWVGYLFFTLIFWWWWEFRLGTIETWTFYLYLFVVFLVRPPQEGESHWTNRRHLGAAAVLVGVVTVSLGIHLFTAGSQAPARLSSTSPTAVPRRSRAGT